ncbi:hypothetical protein ACEU2D_19800 [Brevibacillus laterosporus]|uniref:hypothetical protein n=1 Tax=Brevibacillus laterosporus TaxID=1465 RepID=UPI0035A588CE
MEKKEEHITDEFESELEDEEIDDDSELENQEYFLCFTSRLKELVKSVAADEGVDINFSKEGTKKLQSTIKFLTISLTYELIDVMTKNKRKRMSPYFIDCALDKMISQADSYGIALNELEQLKEKLDSLNESSSITKATYFINLKDTRKGE